MLVKRQPPPLAYSFEQKACTFFFELLYEVVDLRRLER